jgi:hypothetical protein
VRYLPIGFDWLVWRSIKENLTLRPSNGPGPLAVAVQHHKTEDQIPDAYVDSGMSFALHPR